MKRITGQEIVRDTVKLLPKSPEIEKSQSVIKCLYVNLIIINGYNISAIIARYIARASYSLQINILIFASVEPL